MFDVYFELSKRILKEIEDAQVPYHSKKWNSFLGLNRNKTELAKFLVSELENKNITEKVICVTYGKKCVCLNDNQGVPALYCTQKEADRIILHAKHASDRYRDIVIHTPDTVVVVLAIAFSKDIDSNILAKTGFKNKARMISIERIGKNSQIGKTFFTEKYHFFFSIRVFFHGH